jgi:hypothetical protein
MRPRKGVGVVSRGKYANMRPKIERSISSNTDSTFVEHAVVVQYLQTLYSDEIKRETNLSDRARTFVSINSIMIGINAFKATDLVQTKSIIIEKDAIFIGTIFFIGIYLISTVTCLISIGMKSYEKLNEPTAIVSRLDQYNWSANRFHLDCMADYIIATNRNTKLNDVRAKWLRGATALMLFGITLECILLLYVIGTLVRR